MVGLRRSAPAQLVQHGEDLIQGRRVENSQTLQAVALVESACLKDEGDGGGSQAIVSVGLNEHGAWEARCALRAGEGYGSRR